MIGKALGRYMILEKLVQGGIIPGSDTSASRGPVVRFATDFDTGSLGPGPDGRSIAVSAVFARRSLKPAE